MAINFEALAGTLSLNVAPWTSGWDKAGNRMSQGINQITQGAQRIGRSVNQIGRDFSMAFAAIGAAVTALATASVRDFATFEQTMARVRALLSGGITDAGQLEKAYQSLAAQAKQLGIDTVFSSQQAAEGMAKFAQAGFHLDEIMQAMPGTLDLAAAAQIEVSEAAQITAGVLRGMQLPVAQTTHLVDVLAKASTTSKTPITDLGEAMKFVGPIASLSGVSIEKCVASIQLLTNRALPASMAGTGLRDVMAHLAQNGAEVRKTFGGLGIAIRDTSGHMRPLDRIIDDFNRRLVETGQEAFADAKAFEAFGLRGGPAFAVMLQAGGAEMRKFTAALEDAGGTADRIAKIQLNTLHGQTILLTSSLKVLGIEVGAKLSPVIRELLKNTTDWVNANIQMIATGAEKWWGKICDGITATARAAGRLYEIATPAIDGVRERLNSLQAGATRVFDSMPQWARDVVLVTGVLFGLSTVMGRMGGMLPFVGGLFIEFSNLINPVKLLTTGFGFLSGAVGVFLGFIGVLGAPIWLVVAAITAIGAPIGVAIARSQEARDVIGGAFAEISKLTMQLVGGAMKILADTWNKTKDDLTAVGLSLVKIMVGVLAACKPAAQYMGGEFLTAVKLLADSFVSLVKAASGVVSLLKGDWREGLMSFNSAMVGLLKSMAHFIRMASWVPFINLGPAAEAAADAVDKYADSFEHAAEQTQKQIDKEKALVEAMLAKQKAVRDADSKPYSQGDVVDQAAQDKVSAAWRKQMENDPESPAATPSAGATAGMPGADFAGSSSGAGVMPGASGSPSVGGHEAPAVPRIMDPDYLRKNFGDYFGQMKHPAAMDMFGQFKGDLSKALNPGDGKAVNADAAKAILANYRSMFEMIPGFSETAWAKVESDAKKAIDGATKALPDFREQFVKAFADGLGDGGKVLADTIAQKAAKDAQAKIDNARAAQANRPAMVAQQFGMMSAGMQAAQLQGGLSEASAAGATQQQLKALAALKKNVESAYADMKNAGADAKDAALKSAQDMLKAYMAMYDKITVKSREAANAEIKDDERVEKTATSLAAKEAKDRKARLAGIDPNAPAVDPNNPNAGLAVRGVNPPPGQAGQQPGGVAVAGQAAQGKGAVGPQPGLLDGVSAVAGKITGAISNAFGATTGLNFDAQGMINSAGTPLQQLAAQINSMKSKIGVAGMNARGYSDYQTIETMKTAMKNLEGRRLKMVAEQHQQQKQAESDREKTFQRQRAEQANRDAVNRETNNAIGGMVAVGSQRPTNIININGVNDISQAVDNMEKELQRRGHHVGVKRKLETQTPGQIW